MICRRCGTRNADEKEFCRQCGSSLRWQAVVNASAVNSSRGAVYGLVVAAVALAVGLLLAYTPALSTLTRSAAPAATAPADSPTPVDHDITSQSSPGDRSMQLGAPPPGAPVAPSPTSAQSPGLSTGARSSANGAFTPPPGIPSNLPAVSSTGAAPTPSQPIVGVAPDSPGSPEREASLAFVNAVSPAVSQTRDTLTRFTGQWGGARGFANTLRATPSSDAAAIVIRNLEQARATVSGADAVLRRNPAPPWLGQLQGTLRRAFDSAGTALDRAIAVSKSPDSGGIDEVGTLLDAAGKEFGLASSALDSTNARLVNR